MANNLEVVSMSLPKQLDEQIEKEARIGNFVSKSEFVRFLVRLWQEDKLAKEIDEAEKDIAAGRIKEIKSLKELR
ncbi:MAG: ribbon-helix-helix protein, CopG family [Minisyncoccales bacterium]